MLSKLLNLKKQSFSQINPLKFIPYALTFLYLIYIFYICFLADPNGYSWGNVGIKLQSIDFGGFGSLLAGIFSPLAFLWLLLTFKQTDKNLHIAQKQLMILEEKEENRKKLIKPILHEVKISSIPNFAFTNWIKYSIELSVNGSLERIIFNIPTSSDKLKIEKDYLIFSPRQRKPCFPMYKSFKDESITFICSFNISNINENEILELRLCYLDIDGNDHTTPIFFKYTPVFHTINKEKVRKDGDQNSFKVSLDNNW